MSEQRLRELLDADVTAAEREAEERGWAVVKAAYSERTPAAQPRSQRAVILALAGAALLLALLFSPAGAQVRDWIEDVVQPGEEHAARSLTALPSSGRLLVESGVGVWIVDEDGGKRNLGAYDEAAWSPNGRFVAAAQDRELTAVVADSETTGEPVGNPRWSLGEPATVRDIAWSPSGIRIAYRAADELRLVAGDGTGDRTLVETSAPVTPQWKPLSTAEQREVDPATGIAANARNVLAYVGTDQAVRVIDVDSGRVLWHSAPFTGGVRDLAWSPDGRSLLVLGDGFYTVSSALGKPLGKGSAGAGATSASYSPAGDRVAILRRVDGPKSARSVISLIQPGPGATGPRRLYAGPGRFAEPTWSPDGSTLLVAWPAADQWLFLEPGEPAKPEAVAGIARQFDPGGRGPAAFPHISGWCCTQ